VNELYCLEYKPLNMKIIPVICLSSLLISCDKNNSPANPVLRNGVYSNGQLATGNITLSGVSAPAGYSWSEAQYNTTTNVANFIIGIACGYTASSDYRPADDFVIPAGQTWKISKISTYAIASTGVSNPFDALRLQIWNGSPAVAGTAIVYGDLTTNRLSQRLDSMICPIQNSILPAPGVTPLANTTIWKLSADVDIELTSGTYWLVYQTHHISNIDCFSPLVKSKGQRGVPGWNALVFNSLLVWQTVVDSGSPVTYPQIPQDLPFEIIYKY